MTIAETARLLECSRTQVYRWIEKGELHVSRHPLFAKGARVRIPRTDVDRLLAKLKS